MNGEKLDFSLPERRPRRVGVNAVILLLLLVLVGLSLFDFVNERPQPGAEKQMNSNLSAEQVRKLATKLAQRGLYKQAAEVWDAYLSSPGLTAGERARTLFQIGTLYEKTGRYADAIEYYYRSEMTSEPGDMEDEINAHVQACFEKSGRFAALRYELIDRTSLTSQLPEDARVVAEIGSQKVTAADFDRMIERRIDNQLEALSAFVTAEELDEQKRNMLEQYKGRQAREQFLQNWIMQDVLYREALREGIGDSEEVKQVLDELYRNVLSQHVMNQQLADNVHITESDLRMYYEANKSDYMEDVNEPNDTGKRQQSFDEVRAQVMSELAAQKRLDVQQQYIEELMNEYDVVIHRSAFDNVEANKK